MIYLKKIIIKIKHILFYVFLFMIFSCKKEDQPNIILIMTDDQGWGDVSYNNHPYLSTPNLNEMAKSGAVLTRFYSASPVCSPTRASVMTGRHPERMGICGANCGHIMDKEITIAEMVKKKGYRTGFFGKWHLGTLSVDFLDANRGGKKENQIHYAPPWNHGFDVSFATESKVPTWDPMITPNKSAGDVKSSLIEGGFFGTSYWTGLGKRVNQNLNGDDSKIIMDRVIPFIEESASQKQNFLSIIWFHAPHLPVLTGEKYKSMYSELSEDQQHYYGVISALDKQVGRLRKKLKNLGISENTLIFYSSDNGPETSLEVRNENIPFARAQGLTNGLRGRKRSLYEGGIRVPGIVEWPSKIQPGTQVNVPCFTTDYFPTIASVIGIDLQEYQRPYDGEDIMKYLKQKKLKRIKPLTFKYKKQFAVIDNDFKLYGVSGETLQLYNLKKDFGEKKDISKINPNKLNALNVIYKDWNLSVEKSNTGSDY